MTFPDPQTWTPYKTEKPATAGVYHWRVPLAQYEGLSLTFYAHMRMRGNGYAPDVLSPVFDHWDGYRVTVPAGTEWREVENPPEITKYQERGLTVVGVKNAPCPFCGDFPTWKAARRSGNGIIVSSNYQANTWWLECCSWARTPHFTDPRKLSEARNKLIGSSALQKKEKC